MATYPSQPTDAEFLASLRGMVNDAAPHLAVPTAASVIPLARRRVAHRRALMSGAFGVALLAGAGVTQILPHPVGYSPAPLAEVAPMSELAPRAGTTPFADGPVGIQPAGNEPIAPAPVGIAPMTEGITPADADIAGAAEASDDTGLSTETGTPVETDVPAETGMPVETVASAATNPANLLVPGLLLTGTSGLVFSGILEARARRRYAAATSPLPR